MTGTDTQLDRVHLDDDPSVAASHGPGFRAPLLATRRSWSLREGLRLECGAHLAPIEVAYETWGRRSAAGDNAVLICHALTGTAHAAGRYATDEARAGWWDPLIGPGRAFDTERYYVICANVLGGCQGTTGPGSIAPAHASRPGQPYGSTFPQVTVRDIVRLQRALLAALGVTRLAAVAGGSLGGMQVLEWLVTYPELVATAIPIAASLAHSAQGIGFNLVGREAIMRDPAWAGGDYYRTGRAPEHGLAIARMVGMLTYQSEASMRRKFDRAPHGAADDPPAADGWATPGADAFQIERYLRYQGRSLVERFDANSYLVLSRAMDLHDVGRGRGGLDAALRQVSPETRTLAVGISSDILFPGEQQREIAERLAQVGRRAEYHEIASPWGHDAFLIEYEQLSTAIAGFLGGGP
jgi:homoserine O-acetyltransferase/O-succinyltransferase